MRWQIGWKHLQDDIELLGVESDYTCLVWTLPEGEDPDSAYSSVPYEKVTRIAVSFSFTFILMNIMINMNTMMNLMNMLLELPEYDDIVM